MMIEGILTSRSRNHVFVVYRRQGGEIVHIHEAEATDGRREIPETELQESAFYLACRINSLSRAELDILRVKKEEVEKEVRYTVDVDRKTLVSTEAELAGQGRGRSRKRRLTGAPPARPPK